MKPSDPPLAEMPAVLRQLRRLLQGYSMAGIAEYPLEPWSGESPRHGLAWPDKAHRKCHKEDLNTLQKELAGCTRCRLHEQRKNLVFGEGSACAPIVFVGEGPGSEEDALGRPFVGRAGKLLDKMIQSIGLKRGDVYICNVVKCRPPKNRTPQQEEVETCFPYLARQLAVLSPKVICALGASAARTLLGTERAISRLRGKVHAWRGTPLICTFHPAYLLRNPAQKSAVWEDLLHLQTFLEQGSKSP